MRANEEAFPGPLFLLGKTLNALLLDRLDSDIDRLRRINKILEAGCRVYGPHFLDEINQAMGTPPGKQGMRPLATVLVRASADHRHARRRVRARAVASSSATPACSAASCAAWPRPKELRKPTCSPTSSSTVTSRAS